MSELEPAENISLTKKQIIISAYLAIAVLFTIWNTFFGSENYRGFFYNMGKSLVWPFQLFPIFGRIIGSLLIFAFIVVFVILDPKKDLNRDSGE